MPARFGPTDRGEAARRELTTRDKEPTRALVLGAGGMLGHVLLQRLLRTFDAAGTVRGLPPPELLAGVPEARIHTAVAADDFDTVRRALDVFRPDILFNCIGVIKQSATARDPVPTIHTNALFPHQLAREAADRGIRLVQFSTDCVFSGAGGPYKEEDDPDPKDLYGRTKLLGEVDQPSAVTIRSSIIGHSLVGGGGLLDWLVRNKRGRIDGFARALYSGVSTPVMAELCVRLAVEWRTLTGIWHVAGPAVSKFDLLSLANQIYRLGISVRRNEHFHCDRRLDGSRFTTATGWKAPSWEEMLTELNTNWTQRRRKQSPA